MSPVDLLHPLLTLVQTQPLAQGVGFLALLIGSSAFTQRNDERLRRRLTLFQVAMSLHFCLMGANAAAFSAGLSCGRTVISGHTRHRGIMAVFLLLVWGLGVPNVHSAVQWLPLVGTTLGTWGLFREQGIRLRLCMFAGALCWVTHNAAIGSVGGTLIETSFLFINGHTIYRLWRQPALASSPRPGKA